MGPEESIWASTIGVLGGSEETAKRESVVVTSPLCEDIEREWLSSACRLAPL
jgi:hypothetical protein